MPRLMAATCWLILGARLVPVFAQPADEAPKKLHGTWAATKARARGPHHVQARQALTGH
jgi:hypothetical protein